MSNVKDRRRSKAPLEDADVAMFRRAVEAHDGGDLDEARNCFAAACHARFSEHVERCCFEEATTDLIKTYGLRGRILPLAMAPESGAARKSRKRSAASSPKRTPPRVNGPSGRLNGARTNGASHR
jgi:hypothetical protein